MSSQLSSIALEFMQITGETWIPHTGPHGSGSGFAVNVRGCDSLLG